MHRARPFAVAVAAVLAGTALLVASVAVPGSAQTPGAATQRIAGADRFETAVGISQEAFPGPSDATSAFVANGRRFPDALSAPSIAGTYVGPVLLTERDRLPAVVREELERLEIADVFVVGGPDAVSDGVEDQLEQRFGDQSVHRLAGADRFGTAAQVARAVAGATGIGEVGGRRTAFLANGHRFPDALTAGPPSYEHRLPILLTHADRLPADTRAAIEDLDIEHVVVTGGPAVVTARVAAEIERLNDGATTVERVAGRDRTDTAVQMAGWVTSRIRYNLDQLVLTRGREFADALAAAPYAAALNGPVTLTRDADTISYDLLQFLVDAAGQVETYVGIGGEAALTPRVLARAAEATKVPERVVAYRVADISDPGGADPAFFAEHVDWTLVDQRGWSLGNDVRYDRVDQGGELEILLADPEQVDSAAPVCSPEFSCTVGDTVYINEDRWFDGGRGRWDDPSLLDRYRHYVVTHEVGHWIGFGHLECEEPKDGSPSYWEDGDGRPAPVMEQQSIASGPCVINAWPLAVDSPEDPWGQGDESELSRARDLYPVGDSAP